LQFCTRDLKEFCIYGIGHIRKTKLSTTAQQMLFLNFSQLPLLNYKF